MRWVVVCTGTTDHTTIIYTRNVFVHAVSRSHHNASEMWLCYIVDFNFSGISQKEKRRIYNLLCLSAAHRNTLLASRDNLEYSPTHQKMERKCNEHVDQHRLIMRNSKTFQTKTAKSNSILHNIGCFDVVHHIYGPIAFHAFGKLFHESIDTNGDVGKSRNIAAIRIDTI